jgi:hypothetical protein
VLIPVHGRTLRGHTAWDAAAGPANRSFDALGASFPYIPGIAACCNRFVMSSSHLQPSFKE